MHRVVRLTIRLSDSPATIPMCSLWWHQFYSVTALPPFLK
nr:MAG TPA: hypothetical protein [Bacteriophage sp.]